MFPTQRQSDVASPSLSRQVSQSAHVVMFAMDRHIDRRIALVAETLEADGLSTRLFAPGDRSPKGDPDWVERFSGRGEGPYAAGLRIHRFVRDRLPFLRGTLRRIAWRVVQQPENAFQSLFASVIERAAAKVYVAHDLPMLPVALAAKRLHGGKVVLDCHELYPEQEFSVRERQLWRGVQARYIGQADAVITINPSIARELTQRHGIDEVVVVSNADRFVPASAQGGENRLNEVIGNVEAAPVILYQGGLSMGRNLETLVAAISRMRRGDTKLVFLGDGPAEPLLRMTARQLGIGDRVHFLARVPQAELIDMARGADFGVIPYLGNCLNNMLCTPNKLFEFIMARLPIVANDLPEIRRVVAGYQIGLLGDTRSPTEFAQLIDAAIEAKSSHGVAWRAGLERAANELCWEREGAKYLAVVRRLGRASEPRK